MHGYWSIDLEILNTTATSQLPAFASRLREVPDILTAATDEAPLPGGRHRPQRRAQLRRLNGSHNPGQLPIPGR